MMKNPENQIINTGIPQDMDEHKPISNQPEARRIRSFLNIQAFIILLVFLVGLGSGYLLGMSNHQENNDSVRHNPVALAEKVNPVSGYALPATYGDIGPQLLAAGAIDLDKFMLAHAQAGHPLSEKQLAVLKDGSDAQIVINNENAHFLLNLFWAFGLANQNPILTEGPMMSQGIEQMSRFASTGSWSLAAKPIVEVYAQSPMISLTKDQQELVEEVASHVYRPCCNNPTHFPDCNHGMAMLGLLELMAARGASGEELYEAAMYINAFWYLPQTIELAMFFKTKENLDFDQVDPQMVVGMNFSSAFGYQNVRQWLIANGELQQVPGGGSSC